MSQNWSLQGAPNGLLVQDNPWGALNERYQSNEWDLTVDIHSGTGPLGLASASFDFPGYDPRYVLAYPSMIWGSKFGSTPDTSGGALPKQLSECDFKIDFEWAIDAEPDAQYNVAIETFFHSSLPITGPGHPSGENNKMFELMVWLARPHDPTLFLGEMLGTFSDDGERRFGIHRHSRGDYIAFIPAEGVQYKRGSLNWLDFVKRAEQAMDIDLRTTTYMSALELGPEVWGGRGEFIWNRFDVSQINGMTADDPGTPTPSPDAVCFTVEQVAQLARYHHELSVSHNRIARLYEDAGKPK